MKSLTYLCYCVMFCMPLTAMSLPVLEDATHDRFNSYELSIVAPKISYISSSQKLHVQSDSPMDIKEIRLYSILGQKVKQWNNLQSDASGTLSLSLANMSKGTYLVSVKTETGNYNKRLIIGN